MKNLEQWQKYADRGEGENAVWWLMNVRRFNRRSAEALVESYIEKQASSK